MCPIKLLTHHQIRTSGNVGAIDNKEILFATRTLTQYYASTLAYSDDDALNITNERKFYNGNGEVTNSDVESVEDITNFLSLSDKTTREIQAELYDVGLEMLPNYFVFSEYVDNVVGLVAGYVVHMVTFQYF